MLDAAQYTERSSANPAGEVQYVGYLGVQVPGHEIEPQVA